ncbi:MAG: hypothetical protein BRD50_05685 [Bacteroidetes bacterium SW_11_45_7]|nr:MAG: hypothetical protein BRD50_05685 [Bacteroidetes bacterium SW_11_45_7]
MGLATATFAQDDGSDVIVTTNLTKEHWYDKLDKAKKNPQDVHYLDLSLEKRRSFPEVIFTFTNLKELHAPYNYWESIPSQIGQMKSLRLLDLSGNYYMGKLPDALGNLNNLDSLILKDHKLAPGEIGDVKKQLPETTIIHQHHKNAD